MQMSKIELKSKFQQTFRLGFLLTPT
jgi:hypothetical protein